MQLITNAELKAKAKAAYEAKTLCAQMPSGERHALYRVTMDGRTYNCAIGAAMSPKTLKYIEDRHLNGYTISGLEHEEIVRFEDIAFAKKFQNAHDEWLNLLEEKDRVFPADDAVKEERNARRRFLRMLNS